MNALALPTSSCRVEVVGAERSTWEAAALEVGAADWPSNCQSVLVQAERDQIVLTFRSGDGRETRRELVDPIELVPTVQSLAVIGPNPPEAHGPLTPAATPTYDEILHDKAALQPSTGSDPYTLSPVFGAYLGTREGADHLVSPLIGGSAALLLQRWEIGLLGRYEARYIHEGGGNDERPYTSGIAFGTTLGRRELLGAFSLRAGALLLLAALHEEERNRQGRAEGRLGAYLGAAWPAQSSTRLRADAAAEFVPYNVGASEQNAAGAASFPWWALTYTLGAEF